MTRHVRYSVSDQESGNGEYARSTIKPVTTLNGHCLEATLQQSEDLVAELAGLRRRLDSLPVIEQSKGILICYFGIDDDTAFKVLRRWSSHSNIKLRDISQLVVDAASAPPAPGRPPRAALCELITRLQGGNSPAKSVNRSG